MRAVIESRPDILPKQQSHWGLRVNHGSRDVECGVALVIHTVHVLEGVSRKRVDEQARGVRVGHVLNLRQQQRTAINQQQLTRPPKDQWPAERLLL